jgi:hypothetical protein
VLLELGRAPLLSDTELLLSGAQRRRARRRRLLVLQAVADGARRVARDGVAAVEAVGRRRVGRRLDRVDQLRRRLKLLVLLHLLCVIEGVLGLVSAGGKRWGGVAAAMICWARLSGSITILAGVFQLPSC